MSVRYRIVHISDLHVWRFTANPLRWFGKRALGLLNLAARRARKFKKTELGRLLQTIDRDAPDHLIVSGDLTTTSLDAEYEDLRDAFGSRLDHPERLTLLPGNHDRYTRKVHRERTFESFFGNLCEQGRFPFLKPLTSGLDLIGFDPNVPRPLSARGLAGEPDLRVLEDLLREVDNRGTRVLLFGCHYPSEVPPEHADREKGHELVNGSRLLETLSTLTIPVYWLHGHIHFPWRYPSPTSRNIVYLNPGAPLLKRNRGISFGRWVLDWNGSEIRTEWRCLPGTESYFEGTPP